MMKLVTLAFLLLAAVIVTVVTLTFTQRYNQEHPARPSVPTVVCVNHGNYAAYLACEQDQ